MEVMSALAVLIPLLIVALMFVAFVDSRNSQNSQDSNSSFDGYSTDDDSDINQYKYLYGKKISTSDEYEEWSVLMGFTSAICSYLHELMRTAEAGTCDDYAALKNNWYNYYSRLRELCILHKLWNRMIDDYSIFEPTKQQLLLEQNLKTKFETMCMDGEKKAAAEKEMSNRIIQYLSDQPNERAMRRCLVNDLAENNEEKKKALRKVCNHMVSKNILSETHDSKGILLVGIKRSSPRKEKPVCLEPSVFSSTLYSNIDHRMLCKVKHTVGVPEKLDRKKNCCEFTSLSSNEHYHTSLQQCTCPAFEKGMNPCKHMVALAKYLHYIK